MNGKILLILLVLGILISPAAGAINTITAGNWVFIGEGNLDISAAVGDYDKIAHFTSDNGQPDKIVPIDTKTGFFISPVVFSDKLGSWYCWNETLTRSTAPVAFYVEEPFLKIRVRDTTVDVDATNKWVYRGDTAEFFIETNMGVMTERGVAGVPVTIEVKSPEGNTYSALVDTGGNPQSLSVSVPSTPFNPGVAWYTGDSRYPIGTYTVTVESEANYMKDNYDMEGATVSVPVTVLIQTRNPLITTATPTSAPSTMIATVATTITTREPTLPLTTMTTVPATAETTTGPTTPAATAVPATTVPGFGPACAVLAFATANAVLLLRRR